MHAPSRHTSPSASNSASVNSISAAADNGSEKTRSKRVRVAEAVESGVEGFLRFLQRFASTTILILFRPRRALRALLSDRHRETPAFILPLTYLAIGVFLLSLVGQIAGINVLDWIWYADEIGEKVTDALRTEISLASIVVQAIPGMAGVLVMVLIQRWLLHWWPSDQRLSLYVYAYAFGAQSVGLFVVIFSAIGLSTLIPSGESESGSVFELVILTLVIGSIILTFVSPILFSWSALRLRGPRTRRARLKTVPARAWLITALIVGHVVILFGARFPGEMIRAAKGPTSPTLAIQEIVYQRTGAKINFNISFTVFNRSDKTMDWTTRNTELHVTIPYVATGGSGCADGETIFDAPTILDPTGNSVAFVSLPPGKTTWFSARGSMPVTPQLIDALKDAAWGFGIKLNTSTGDGEIDCGSITAHST